MGNDFRITRAIKRVTQEHLETKTGINQTRISLIENGLAEPTQKEKKKLGKALGVDFRDIWEEPVRVKGITFLTQDEPETGN
jgi:transcriptional regulator with XRE-family HTH domain